MKGHIVFLVYKQYVQLVLGKFAGNCTACYSAADNEDIGCSAFQRFVLQLWKDRGRFFLAGHGYIADNML